MTTEIKPLRSLLILLSITFIVLGCGGGGGGSSSGNSNARLDDLALSAATLDQAFQSSQLEYTSRVSFLVASTTVTPTTDDDDATVTVNGSRVASGRPSPSIPLAVGTTVITVRVTAANGSTRRNYSISVTRQSANVFAQQAYIKASNTGNDDLFGTDVALSGDTLAVGAPGEKSSATGVNGNQGNNSLTEAGAVYVFKRNNGNWSQQAYVKASNTGNDDLFGSDVALSGDTLAVGAPGEKSSATGVNGNQGNNSLTEAGAVYVFKRNNNGNWNQQAYIKASNTGNDDRFGSSVALDDKTLAVGAPGEKSSATGVNGNQGNNSLTEAGAVYVFKRNDGNWSQQAYVKASNTGNDDLFGSDVAVSGDTLAVGAPGEKSSATGVNGNQGNNSLTEAGAAYVYTRDNGDWTQQAYIKASNTEDSDRFGARLSLCAEVLVAGASGEDSQATGINGDASDNSLTESGAVYVYSRIDTQWIQQAYVKASNPGNDDRFGESVAVCDDTLGVGAPGENSSATGINGNQANNDLNDAGAAYTFQ